MSPRGSGRALASPTRKPVVAVVRAWLSEVLAGDRPGQKVTVTYLRDTTQKTADVTLGEI